MPIHGAIPYAALAAPAPATATPTTSGASERSTTTSEPVQFTKICRPVAYPASEGPHLARLRESLAADAGLGSRGHGEAPQQRPTCGGGGSFQPSTHSAFSPAQLTRAVAAV